MIITLDLAPDIEQVLLTQAQAKGVSITDFLSNSSSVKFPPEHETHL